VNYTLLAPDIQEEILHLPPVERSNDRLSEHQVRAVLREPLWSEQRRRWRAGEEGLQDGDADAPLRTGPWHGAWAVETIDEKDGGAAWSGTMDLQQDGDRLIGTYGEGTSIEATVYRDVVEGEWSDDDNGRFRWWLTDEGRAFDGTWGRRSHRRGRGTWRGKKCVTQG
jgi:hypothetical protein